MGKLVRLRSGEEVARAMVYLPAHVHRNLKVVAARKSTSVSDLVLQALAEFYDPPEGLGLERPPAARSSRGG